jgi:hypothetical protein
LAASRLGRLQQDVLDAFFRQEQRFVLTGGGALAGFHLVIARRTTSTSSPSKTLSTMACAP